MHSRGLDTFRKLVNFVILTRRLFIRRISVNLNRRDSLLFYMERHASSTYPENAELKFDVSAFKSIGQRTKMATVRSFLELPQCHRTDGQINHMVHTLRSFQKFSRYPNAVQIGLCTRGWYAQFEATKVMVKEGSRADFFYLILSGLAVYRDMDTSADGIDNSHSTTATSYLKAGDTIGEKEILTNTERPVTVVCKEAVEVLGLDRDILLETFKASGGPASLQFLLSIPELADFPLELLPTHNFAMSCHYYRSGAVIVKNSNESEWIYIVKSGSCQVLKAIKDGHRKPIGLHCDIRHAKVGKRHALSNVSVSENLISSSAAEVNNSEDKRMTKNTQTNLLRSYTMLPVLRPGKTQMMQTAIEMDVRTPMPTEVKEVRSKETYTSYMKKFVTESLESEHNIDTNHTTVSDMLHFSRNKSTLGEISCSRHHLQSPSSDALINLTKKMKNTKSHESNGSGKQKQSDASTTKLPKLNSGWSRAMSSEKEDKSVFYVRLGTIAKNGVFGLHTLVFDNIPTLSLVSNGAECELVSKLFLKEHLTNTVVNRLRNKLPQYPSSGQLRNAVGEQICWENYRDKIVSDVLK